MGYFDKFPNLYYDVKKDKKFEFVVDILRRVKINSKAANDASLFGSYTLKDTDRPDTIAHKLYGDSELHWIILLFNEIHNPYYEWPMDYNTLIRYCESKYPGKAFLLDLPKTTQSPIASVRGRRDHKIMPDEYGFLVNSQGEILTNKVCKVLCWDRTMQKAIVSEVTGSFTENEGIAFAVTGSEPATAYGVIKRIQANMEAVRYFVDNAGNQLAPHGTYSALIQSGLLEQRTTVSDGLGGESPIEFENTLLGAYLYGEEAQIIQAVTNLQYEEEQNENRRQIKLPSPEIVQTIVSRFESILNEEF